MKKAQDNVEMLILRFREIVEDGTLSSYAFATILFLFEVAWMGVVVPARSLDNNSRADSENGTTALMADAFTSKTLEDGLNSSGVLTHLSKKESNQYLS